MRWIKTRASVSLQRDSAGRPSAVRRRREARVEGERSELATTRRRQSVRRAAITRSSNLRRAALGRGKKAQRSGASGKPACKSCRRGGNGRRCRRRWDGGEPHATSSGDDVRRSVPHGWAMASWVEGSRGRSSWGRGETGDGSELSQTRERSSRGQLENVGQKETPMD